jgi:hypothetical protein
MTDSARDYEGALAYARAQHDRPTQDWEGYCQKFMRSCYGIPPLFTSAYAQWLGADPEDRHAGGSPSDAPLGSALVYKGTGPYGHIMLAARPFPNGVAAAWSNDLVHRGRIDKVARTAPVTAWRQGYLGYLTAVNDVDLRYLRPQNRRYQAIARAIANLETALATAKVQRDAADIKTLTGELDRLHTLYDTLRRY